MDRQWIIATMLSASFVGVVSCDRTGITSQDRDASSLQAEYKGYKLGMRLDEAIKNAKERQHPVSFNHLLPSQVFQLSERPDSAFFQSTYGGYRTDVELAFQKFAGNSYLVGMYLKVDSGMKDQVRTEAGDTFNKEIHKMLTDSFGASISTPPGCFYFRGAGPMTQNRRWVTIPPMPQRTISVTSSYGAIFIRMQDLGISQKAWEEEDHQRLQNSLPKKASSDAGAQDK